MATNEESGVAGLLAQWRRALLSALATTNEALVARGESRRAALVEGNTEEGTAVLGFAYHTRGYVMLYNPELLLYHPGRSLDDASLWPAATFRIYELFRSEEAADLPMREVSYVLEPDERDSTTVFVEKGDPQRTPVDPAETWNTLLRKVLTAVSPARYTS